MDVFIGNEHHSAQEDSSSLGISHQDSGLTDEDLFDSHRYESDVSHEGEDDEYSQEDTGAAAELPRTTPPTTKQKQRTDITTDRGPLSPFSPLACSQQALESTTSITWQSQEDHELSLLPCRKVSVVVKVHVPDNNERQCVFPLISSSSSSDGAAVVSDESPTCTRDLVVVNPIAFGKYIPAKFTMDTARLVANVASIESEDWARRYRFDQIFFNGESQIFKLAASMGNDAVQRGSGSICIGIGGANASGKRHTMFGDCSGERNENNHGILGMVAANVLSQLSEHTVCTLSILEIVDEDVLKDLLVVRGRTPSTVTIRHIDQKGAVVHGLSDMPLDSMTGLNHLMKRACASSSQPQEPRGHIICSLKVWQNGVQLDLKNKAKCTTITLVDLASGEEGDGTNEMRMASFRKSVSGLRGVLRSLLQQQRDGLAPNATSYRECTLTQVLQRPLVECQAVVLGNVHASGDCYERTLHTLNYMNRLLIRPGKTARSPFTPQNQKNNAKAIESRALFDRYGDGGALLESVVSDPRQRLAKVMPRRPFTSTPVKLNLKEESGEEKYEPIDYMEFDPGVVNKREVPASPMWRKLEDVSRRHDFSFDDSSHGHKDSDMGIPSTDEVENRSNDETDRAFFGDNDRVSASSSPRMDLKSKQQQLLSGIDAVKFKTIGSPSEESSTQPVDSMSTSVRTGLRLAQSPDDVNDWVASFEANAEERPESVHANALPSENADKPFAKQSTDAFKKNSLKKIKARGSDWEDQQHDDTGSDQSEQVECPSPNEIDMNEMNTRFQGGNASGDGRKQQEADKEIRDTSRLEVEIPFAERRKVFSTPIAHLPEVDDDESAMSLSSLHKDVGNDVHRPYLSEPSPRVGGTIEKFNPGQSRSLTPPVPRRIETPSRNKRIEVTQYAAKSPADDCIGEIHVLEDAVDQIKRVHNGLWETSAASLDRLRRSQELQKRIIEDAVTARRESEAEIERLEHLVARETEEREKLSREYDERMEVMESRIQKSLTDCNDLEKIAEEAIAAQDGLEKELMQTQEELDQFREAAEKATLDYSDEVESNKNLAKQLEMALKSLNQMRSDHNDCKDVIADLERTIGNLRIENGELKKERDASQALSIDHSRIVAEQGRLKQQFDRCQQEISMLQDENEKLTSNIHDYQDRLKKADEQQTTLRVQYESENVALQNDVDEWQRRYLQVEDAKEREVQEFRESRAVLMTELSDVKKQLEESRAEVASLRATDHDLAMQRDKEIDMLTSELRELQLERDRDRTLLSDIEQKYERLRNDAKEKLKQLVKEKKAAASTIETLKKENAAHGDANRHLRYRIEQTERDRESLQSRMNDVLERLEVEGAARREAEDRIQHLESSQTRPSGTPLDLEDMSSHSSLHLGHYSEAEQALLREIEAEKSNTERRSSSSLAGVTSPPNTRTLNKKNEIQQQRELLAHFQRDFDARHGSEGQSDSGVVPFDAYRAEQNRRSHAEELVAAIGALTKESIEKRNKEIMNLKIQLALVADEKEAEILRLRSQLHSLKRESIS